MEYVFLPIYFCIFCANFSIFCYRLLSSLLFIIFSTPHSSIVSSVSSGTRIWIGIIKILCYHITNKINCRTFNEMCPL